MLTPLKCKKCGAYHLWIEEPLVRRKPLVNRTPEDSTTYDDAKRRMADYSSRDETSLRMPRTVKLATDAETGTRKSFTWLAEGNENEATYGGVHRWDIETERCTSRQLGRDKHGSF